MKKSVTTIILLCLCAVSGVRAQLSALNGMWYDGTLVYETTLEGQKAVFEASDEGEDMQFVLKPVEGEADRYRLLREDRNIMSPFDEGTLVSHQQQSGWNVLCFYNADGQLEGVMEKTTVWNAQKLNVARWLNQVTGDYTTADGLHVSIQWEQVKVGSKTVPFLVDTFNGHVTGIITINDRSTPLHGSWQLSPTPQGLRLIEMVQPDGGGWWKDTDKQLMLRESNPDVDRFFFATTTLLAGSLARYDKPTLRLMRNAILAHHGYRFQSADLQEHFGREPWYQPADDNSAVKLTLLEQLNVDLIKREEAK